MYRKRAAPLPPSERVAVKRQVAGQMLDCSVTTIWKMCKAGRLKTIKVGTEDRILVSSIHELAQ